MNNYNNLQSEFQKKAMHVLLTFMNIHGDNFPLAKNAR